jgi:type II secretory pathway component PulF
VNVLKRYVTPARLIAAGLLAVFFVIRSTGWRLVLVAAAVVTYLVLQRRRGRASQVVTEGLEDFTERLPGVGGLLGRLFTRPVPSTGPSADKRTEGS